MTPHANLSFLWESGDLMCVIIFWDRAQLSFGPLLNLQLFFFLI